MLYNIGRFLQPSSFQMNLALEVLRPFFSSKNSQNCHFYCKNQNFKKIAHLTIRSCSRLGKQTKKTRIPPNQALQVFAPTN